MHRCHLKENSKMRMEQLYEALTTLRGSQAYSNVSYKLTDTPQGYQLHFIWKRSMNVILIWVSVLIRKRLPRFC